MEKFKVLLLAIIAALLLIEVIDRSRASAQLGAVDASVKQLSKTVENLQGKTTVVQQTTTNPTGTNPEKSDPNRDGNPKLGVNFLLPYDRSHFHQEWVGGTLKNFFDTSKNLNPLIDSSSSTANVHNYVNESLAFRHPKVPEQWMASLAESVVISDDYKTYTFKIRNDAKWQTPAIAAKPEFAWAAKPVKLTAQDFVFYFQMVQDPDVRCPHLKAYYEDLDKAEAVDEHTLKVTWRRKIYSSLSATMSVSPLPRHIYTRNRDGSEIPAANVGVQFNDHWFDKERQAIGVGPFILVSYEPDQLVRFKRDPDFWGAGFHFESMDWVCSVKHPDAQLVGFKNGDSHVYGLSPHQYKSEILDRHEPRFAAADANNPKAGRSGDLGWERIKAMSFTYLGWNMKSDLFRDKLVRQAMSHAFPKDRLIKEVYYGLGQPVLSDVHPDSLYYNKDLKPYEFDLDVAKKLLADAGWKDSDGDGLLDKDFNGTRKPFRFSIKYSTDAPEWDNSLLIFRNELRKIGVEMEMKPYEWKELMRIYEDRDFEAMVGGWAMDWEIDYFQLWHSSQADLPGSSNHCSFANKRVDELADKLRTTFETPERIAIAKEIQAIIHDEQPYTFFKSGEGIFCWQNQGPAAKDRYLDGITLGFDTLHPLVNRSRLFWHFRN